MQTFKMQENLKDILSNLSTEIDQETLLLYLQGKLSAEQQHEVEEKMVDNEFAADAIDGLQNFKDQQKIQLIVDGLNRDLKNRTNKKKAFRDKLRLKNDPWMPIAILLFLLLVILCYFVVHYLLNK